MECYDYLPFGRMIGAGVNQRSSSCYTTSPDVNYSSEPRRNSPAKNGMWKPGWITSLPDTTLEPKADSYPWILIMPVLQ